MKASALSLYIWINILVSFFVNVTSATAQSIKTDGTTPTQPANCSGDCTIEGGLQQGNNLFHSFERFNVDDGATVLFQDSGVANIFSRVTGNGFSEILGTLGVTGGDANLFLLNPNGILFGQHSSLDINGSFLATTANAIRFGEQGFFAATPNEIPLLTIDPSALSFAQGNQGNIVNQSIVSAGERPPGNSIFGLRVPNNKNLLLVGGDVILDGGEINASGGRVELGGLAESGEIKLNFSNDEDNISLELPEQIQRSNVSLINGANISVFSPDGGDIAINAENISISDNSELVIFIFEESTIPDSQGGNITLNANQNLEIEDSSVANQVFPQGNSGDININSGSLLISNQSFLLTTVFGEGNSGNIKIDVPRGKIEIIGDLQQGSPLISASNGEGTVGNSGDITIAGREISLNNSSNIDVSTYGRGNAGDINISVEEKISLFNQSFILSNVSTGAIGNGGEIDIQTKNLALNSGSQLVADVAPEDTQNNIAGGRGKGGNISLNDLDSINITGIGRDGISSGIVTATEIGAEGRSGDITINTNSFRIADGAIVSSQTVNDSDGGDITINANTFEAVNGGQIIASGDGFGNSGDIKIKVADNILLSGKDPKFADRLAEFDNNIEEFQKNVGNEAPGNSGFFASSRQNASGKGGNIEVTTRELTIQKSAEIKVSATGTGEAGTLTIDSQNVTLDRGELTATTRRGDRGNITLTNADSLLLRNQSQIKTDAEESATGGNISLFADAIALLDNSNITARAFEGSGGQIALTTQGIFQETGSEINASSQLGIDGEITINSPDVDPTSEIFQLTDVPIDAEAILGQNLCKLEGDKIAKGSSFIVTGRGGLTPTSAESLGNVDNIVRWANRDDLEVSDNGLVGVRQRQINNVAKANYPVMQQSQGWVTTTDGSVWLVANSPKTIPQHTPAVHPDCGTLSE